MGRPNFVYEMKIVIDYAIWNDDRSGKCRCFIN